MNILVENSGYHLRNLGDVAMLQAACRLFLEHNPNMRLHVFTTDPERLRLLCPRVEPVIAEGQAAWLSAKCFPLPRRLLLQRFRNVVFNSEKDYKYANPDKALSIMQRRRDFRNYHAAKVELWLAAIESADAVVATGGGYLTDAFGGHLEGLLHTLAWARKKGRMTAFFGQGLGPLQDPRLRKSAGVALREADLVTLRENLKGPTLGAELQCETRTWKTTGDDAFALLASASQKMTAGPSIGINLRVAHYSGFDLSAADRLAKALEAVRLDYKTTWMPLPVDLCPTRGDAVQTLSLLMKKSLSSAYQLPDTPMDLFSLVGDCRVVVTGSYHAAVFSLARGVPVVGLAANPYYEDKFNGLGAFFPGGLRIVDHSKPSVAETLSEEVAALWSMSVPDRCKLWNQVQDIAATVAGAYQQFLERLSQRIGTR